MNLPVTLDAATAATRAWVERAVIGLNLCPFAKAPQVRGQVRYVVSQAIDTEALLSDLADELVRLEATPAAHLETTLLIHPQVLRDFADYNDFLDLADAAVRALGLEGVVQVASFHPHYQFAGTEWGDVANATNRSPYPTLHLLREASLDRAVEAFPQAESIFETNIATLRSLGPEGWAAVQQQCRLAADAHPAVHGHGGPWPSPSRG
jgi:uncharacterized protein